MGDEPKPGLLRVAPFALALALSVLAAAVAAGASPAASSGGPVAAPAAKAQKLSPAHRLGLERKLATMNRVFNIEPQALNRFPETFGGLWEKKNGKLVLAFTQKPGATVDKLKTTLPEKRFDGVLVDDSLAYLKDLQADVAPMRNPPGAVAIPFDLDVDVKANNVVVTHDPSLNEAIYNASKAAIQAAAGARSEDLVFRRDDLSQPEDWPCKSIFDCRDLRAGLHTRAETSVNCTTAFVVLPPSTLPAGSKGILSAAHCGNPDADVGDDRTHDGLVYGTVHSEQQSGAVDAELHTITHVAFGTMFGVYRNAKTVIGPGTFHVVATSKYDALPIGRLVCRTGITTGGHCGKVTSKTYSPSYVPDSHSFVRASICNESGDSGGPVYIPFSYKPAGATKAVHVAMAVGVLSGGSGDWDCPSENDYTIFSHMTHVNKALGTKVLTLGG